ncbi:MAG: hypothetical protein QXK67_01470 [Pyrobaculum sp.]
MYRPSTDPCIFLHGEAEDWPRLLGEDLVKELIKRFRHVARDLDDFIKYALENPQAVYVGLAGLKVGGRFRQDWAAYVGLGYVSPNYRTQWPFVENGVELDVRIQVSPCFLLSRLDREVVYIWRNRAATIFKWVSQLPRHKPLEVFRRAFPLELRELARSRGYAWVAWTRWRDRRNKHLAEWLYWLDTGRLPHIDYLVRRCGAASCTKIGGAESLYKLAGSYVVG